MASVEYSKDLTYSPWWADFMTGCPDAAILYFMTLSARYERSWFPSDPDEYYTAAWPAGRVRKDVRRKALAKLQEYQLVAPTGDGSRLELTPQPFIRLRGFVARETMPPALRARIIRRDGKLCVYCGKEVRGRQLHIDHKMPIARGGTDDPDNLCVSCANCNRRKHTMTAEEFRWQEASE